MFSLRSFGSRGLNLIGCRGEKNTKFFLCCCTTRKLNNTIIGVEDVTGNRVTGSDMVSVFLNYFQTLFTSSLPDGIDDVVNLIGSRIFLEQRELLDAEFKAAEVKLALDHMPFRKSSGLDGTTVSFYLKY